ncbi:hypothetical protein SERLADRAFT_416477, partial [Serpula lacrymans var. lacrymans S7.9]
MTYTQNAANGNTSFGTYNDVARDQYIIITYVQSGSGDDGALAKVIPKQIQSAVDKEVRDKSCRRAIDNIRKASVNGAIAIKGANGNYLRVTNSGGLEFSSPVVDDDAVFVAQLIGDKLSLIGNNGKYVNMYYLEDVKCEGPGAGLVVGASQRSRGMVSFTISGYQGQDGKTYYLSSDPGNAAYHGSLAVKKEEDQSCQFAIENIVKPNVSGTITIRTIDGRYMKVTGTNGLECSSQDLDDNAKFIVKQKGAKVALIGNNGKYVNMYYVHDVKCEGPSGGLDVGVAYHSNGTVCFTISGYQGQNGNTYYLSCDTGNAAYNGSLAVKRAEDSTCRFVIDNVGGLSGHIATNNMQVRCLLYPHWLIVCFRPKISGIIAIKDVHGRYLKVTDSNGLVFQSRNLDNQAKFHVKLQNGRLNLIGNNGKYVNMYGIDYVQCKGPSGGLTMGVVYLPSGIVKFTISGYQGQNGKTSFLSSSSGRADESLAVVDEGNESSKFLACIVN